MRVFVCSPLRGPDGQPSEANKELARRLMRAVFDAGHAPFVPHLLYPQVLSESEDDLKLAFRANFRFLYTCEEIWVYADDLAGCSNGMRAEVQDVMASAKVMPNGQMYDRPWPLIIYMPEPFKRVREVFNATFSQRNSRMGACSKCHRINIVNHTGICMPCFAEGTPHR